MLRGLPLSKSYTPFFENSLANLSAADLGVLRTVSEGWYVEYKQECPPPKGIAKSISALANTYGGWLFIGIGQGQKPDSTAASFPGIERRLMDGVLMQIRTSIAHHVNPAPHFEYSVIWGPSVEIGLPKDHGVICVEVPESAVAPHIHSSGMVYRRVADSSEPRAETDPHQMELIFSRRERINDQYRRWINRHPELSQDDDGRPYLRILLDADLRRAKNLSWNLSINEFREVLSDFTTGSGFAFSSYSQSDEGFIARQISNSTRHDSLCVTWISRPGGQCEVWIPLNEFYVQKPIDLIDRLIGKRNVSRFIDALAGANFGDLRLLDVSQLLPIMGAISSTFIRLLDKSVISSGDINAKVIAHNVLHAVPFIDSSMVIEMYQDFGVPVSLKSVVSIPRGDDVESFARLNDMLPSTTSENRSVYNALSLFEIACATLGIVGPISSGGIDNLVRFYDEIIQAGNTD